MSAVLLFKYAESMGGGEIATLRWVRHFWNLGESIYLVINPDSPLVKELEERERAKVLLYRYGQEPTSRATILFFLLSWPWRLLVSYWWLRSMVRTHQVTALVLQNLHDKLLFSALGKRLGLRIIWIEHQSWEPSLPKHPLFRSLLQVSRQADQILVPSQFLANELRRYVQPAQLMVIRQAVPKLALPNKGEARRVLGIPQGMVVILTIGRLHLEKGIDLLLTAFEQIAPDHPAKLLIVGDGPERAACAEFVRLHQLTHQVTLTGYLQDYRPHLAAADIVVVASRRDNAPLALLEALEAGKAIIATRVGAIPELVGDAGILIPPEDVTSLATQLRELVVDATKREELSARARRRAARFDFSAQTEGLRNVFFS